MTYPKILFIAHQSWKFLAFVCLSILYLGQLCVNGANLDIGLGHRWISVGVDIGVGIP
jgi:hypothetical protein